MEIGQKYRKWRVEPSESDKEVLRKSLEKEDQIQAIIVDENNDIIDGYSRYDILKELGIEPKIIQKSFISEEDKLALIRALDARKHFNNWQKILKAKMIKSTYTIESCMVNEVEVDNPNEKTILELAEEVGLSHDMLERGFYLLNWASEEIKNKLLNDKMTISYAWSGYNTIDDITDEKKKEILKERFQEGEIDPAQLKKIVNNTSLALEWLASTTDSVQKKLTKEYEGMFWTEDLDVGQLEHDIKSAEGCPVKLKRIEIDISKFKDEDAAKTFAKKCGGYLEGKTEYYKMKIDPLKFKEQDLREKR